MRGPGVLHILHIMLKSFLIAILLLHSVPNGMKISDMEIFQITEGISDPPTNQGAYFSVLLSI